VELQKAIDSVPRRQTVVWPSGGFLTSVAQVEALPPFGVYRPPPPKRPAKPARADVVPAWSSLPPEAEMVAPPAPATRSNDSVTKRHADTPLEPVWQALLDVSVWCSRPWWLRVAASLVVKRLRS
jgi:hypothetical protein